MPSLIGLHPKYLVETMQSFKSGDRPIDEKNQDMKKALDALSDQDLQHIALYYALETENVTRAQTPNGGGAPVAKEALAACVKCHGEDGIGDSPITPSLAGQDLAYMVNALRAYKDGTRDDDTMTPRAKKLDDVAMNEFIGLLRGTGSQAGQYPEAVESRPVGREMRSLSRLERQQHAPGSARPGRATLGLSRSRLKRLSVRRPQEFGDGGDVEHPDARRYQGTRRALCP